MKHKSISSNNLFASTLAAGSGQSPCGPYDLSCNDEEQHCIPENVAERTFRYSERVARLLTAARFLLSPLPESPTNWGQLNLNLTDFHTDPIEITSAKFSLISGSLRECLRECGVER